MRSSVSNREGLYRSVVPRPVHGLIARPLAPEGKSELSPSRSYSGVAPNNTAPPQTVIWWWGSSFQEMVMLGKLLSAAVDVVTLPVSVAVDVVTLGGALVDRDEQYTVSKAKRLGKDAGSVIQKLAE